MYPTTAAQYFHVLRRQAVAANHVPLVCFTPKRYLRMPQSRSPLAAFTDGRFEVVLDDRAAPDNVQRVILCTGKIGHELMDEAATGAVHPRRLCGSSSSTRGPETELFAVPSTATPTPRRCGGRRRSRRTWARGTADPPPAPPGAARPGQAEAHRPGAERGARPAGVPPCTTPSSSACSPPPSPSCSRAGVNARGSRGSRVPAWRGSPPRCRAT